MTTVQFEVTRGDNGAPVPYATVSVYLNATNAPMPCAYGEAVLDNRNCWLTANANGIAEIVVPTGTPLGYLVRSLAPDWLNFATQVVPPVDPGPFTQAQYNDLDALTCTSRGSAAMTPGLLSLCVTNRYFTPRGPSELIEAALPVLNTRAVTVKGLDGGVITGSHAYLIEALPQALPWQDLPPGAKAGFLRYFGEAGTGLQLPGAPGFIEVYGTSNQGFEVAGTEPVTTGGTPAVVETSPVICANPLGQPNVAFAISRPPTNSEFSVTEARWAYAARRSPTQSLTKDLTTTAVVLQFVQSGGPVTVDITQRHRTANGTNTASVTLQCTNGTCTAGTPVAPGTGNPMQPHVFQPKPFKLFWVVQGLDATAESEWSVRVSKQVGNRTVLIEQLPVASKSNTSSAFLLFSKAFTFCDPDFSFDGVYGCDV